MQLGYRHRPPAQGKGVASEDADAPAAQGAAASDRLVGGQRPIGIAPLQVVDHVVEETGVGLRRQ